MFNGNDTIYYSHFDSQKISELWIIEVNVCWKRNVTYECVLINFYLVKVSNIWKRND